MEAEVKAIIGVVSSACMGWVCWVTRGTIRSNVNAEKLQDIQSRTLRIETILMRVHRAVKNGGKKK